MKSDGFVLATWLLSFTLVSLCVVVSFSLLHSWWQHIYRLHHCCDRDVPLYIAIDRLLFDVHQAQKGVRVNKNMLLMSFADKHIKWTYDNQKLLRRSSAYDAAHKRWKGASSLMAESIQSCLFDASIVKNSKQKNKKWVFTMQLTQEKEHAPLVYTMYVRKGMII